MRRVQLREAKAGFSALVEAAEQGEPSLITKHGRAAAMVVPVAAGERLYPGDLPSFADFLLSMPAELEIERDPTPLRDIEF